MRIIVVFFHRLCGSLWFHDLNKSAHSLGVWMAQLQRLWLAAAMVARSRHRQDDMGKKEPGKRTTERSISWRPFIISVATCVAANPWFSF
ncbi:MAG TPA: hypothetical protein VFB63_16965 [Bryobacteraceae bacterium]|nr:hypothetical protein [Bryobacteraceae bacterium]